MAFNTPSDTGGAAQCFRRFDKHFKRLRNLRSAEQAVSGIVQAHGTGKDSSPEISCSVGLPWKSWVGLQDDVA
jgi:hypothetical protein